MKKILATIILLCFLLVGCESLRFAPSQVQKQNAWLHNRTVMVAAETARSEDTSEKLQVLTRLGELQSRAFVSYYGLPKEFPKADSTEDILAESSWQLGRMAVVESADRPDAWQLADNAFELAIGICALLGGMYGTKAVGFLRQVRTKSQALQEVIVGNELFKRDNAGAVAAFKQAHKDQSPQTRQIVAEMKS